MKKIIVLGRSGFIGKNIFESLANDARYKDYVIKGYASKNCNLLDLKSINKALKNVGKEDMIIFASAITREKNDSVESMNKNIDMAKNLCRFLSEKKIKKLIFLSSIDVYKEPLNGKISEKTKTYPKRHYGISKLKSELLLKKTCADKGITLIILRLPGVYGFGDENKSTVGKLVEFAMKGKVTILSNDKRDFIYIMDLCNAVKLCDRINNSITINIVSGKSFTIKHIVMEIKKDIKKFKIILKNCGEKNDKVFDTAMLKSVLPNFKPMFINQGIHLYINQLKSERK